MGEKYTRTEYAGAPEIGAPEKECKWACTYLSERMRICRLLDSSGGEGEDARAWRVYERMPSDAAQGEIGRLMSLPVATPPRYADGPPDWARGGGGLGGGPAAEPGAMM